ncbi:DUF4158 domain-containing protein [Sphaerisporangium perillae]|uniref:DUF4158 domain-containing protein n=1 Tax=Sphaerisporangium perillae TaxID=2935860 RepID=UPI00200D2D77|nr:DUF4158 domain-containing protein [Sphaerisporangium perillae]
MSAPPGAGPERPELERFFFLDDVDRDLIALRRAKHHQLGSALQMCTVRTSVCSVAGGRAPGRAARRRGTHAEGPQALFNQAAGWSRRHRVRAGLDR